MMPLARKTFDGRQILNVTRIDLENDSNFCKLEE